MKYRTLMIIYNIIVYLFKSAKAKKDNHTQSEQCKKLTLCLCILIVCIFVGYNNLFDNAFLLPVSAV